MKPISRLSLWLVCLVSYPAFAAEDVTKLEYFETHIRPVLVEHCYSCHSEEAKTKGKLKGGFLVDTRAALLLGGDSGAGIVPSKPEEGTLLAALKYGPDLQMPPKGKLPDAVIARFERWIKDGAIDPRVQKSLVSNTGPEKSKSSFWAFQAPQIQPPTKIKHLELAPTVIDQYLQATRETKSTQAVPLADRRTLIRRIYMDLIGLPPTPQQVAAYVSDTSDNATLKLIDDLLASPQYGERWGRYWLDVARYAEDQAHTFAVKPRTQAYRYRDWVIQAFNRDMPYDQFIRYQLAGDLLPIQPHDLFTQYAGLGFLGLGAEYYKNSAKEQAIADELDDRVDTVTRGFLGLTVSCARCHDHKFDPIPQKDYYSIAGIFNGSNFAEIPIVPPDVVEAYNLAQQQIKATENRIKEFLIEQGRAEMLPELKRLPEYLTAAWLWNTVPDKLRKESLDIFADHKQLKRSILKKLVRITPPADSNKTPAALRPLAGITVVTPPQSLSAQVPAEITIWIREFSSKVIAGLNSNPKEVNKLLKGIAEDANTPFGFSPEEVEKQISKPDIQEKLTSLKSQLAKQKADAPAALPLAHAVQGGGNTMKVFIRGNPLKPGELAPRGFLQVLSESKPDKEFNRLDLANAIASATNPLTARVIVNRVWQGHFGKGLVNTPSNLGFLGEKPTHPELLDYLTVEFIQHGWSIKWLHRQMMSSNAYQLASQAHAENNKIDADNQTYWRFPRRRLDVEAWRDSLLFVAGALYTTVGGPSFDLRNPQEKRRTVYAKISRHELDGLLRLFDFPDANVTSDKRNSTTVPQQQLFVMNSDFIINLSKSFAQRLEQSSPDLTVQIRSAYQLAFQRDPTANELSLAERFLKQPNQPQDRLTRLQQFAQILLASNELLFVD